ncbi:MAG: VWA domain-containing protein [Anaerolineae bacterium]|nr:VWA domain-containing protein [Anaerolineae bacterium]
MNKRWISSLLVIVIWLVEGGVCSLAQAQDTSPAYTGLDLLFLVDQSGSMGGADFGYPDREATDPLQLRFEAVQYALDTLGEYRLLVAPDLTVRAAVINFGDDAVVTLNWTEVAPTQMEWDNTRQGILDQLSANTFGSVNLGNTNFVSAFEMAQTMFDTLPPDPNQSHLRVIILFTDGQPCVVSGPNFFSCESALGQQQHMDTVNDLVQRAFPPLAYQIYVLALDATGDVWQTRSADWQSVVGLPERATLVETNQQVGVQFYRILAQVVSSTGEDQTSGGLTDAQQLVPGINTVFVPPYQRLMRVSLFKSSNSPGVLSITQSNGLPLAANDPDVTISNQDRPIEVWTIVNPVPGDWVFEVGSQNDRIDIYLELIPLDVTADVTGGSFRQYDDVPLTVTLTDATTQTPLNSYPPPYDLAVEARLTLPDGTETRLPLTSTQPGAYSTVYPADLNGTYTLGLTASVTLPTGEDYIIFDQSDLNTFTVSELILQVDDFPADAYLVGEEVQLTARVVDDAGTIVQDSAIQITARVVDALDTEIVPVEFTDPDGDGQYTAGITWTEAMTNGSLYLDVSAQSSAPIGSVRVGPVSVLPSIMISLFVLEPAPNTEQNVTEGFPPLTATDLDIVFETRLDDDNTLIAVPPLADPAGSPVLTVQLFDDKSGEVRDLVFNTGPQPGQYYTSVSDLPKGTYHLEVTMQGELQDRYVLNPQASHFRVTVERVTNPMLYVFYAGVVLLVLLVIGLTTAIVIRQRRRRKHPAHGTLVIARMDLSHNEKDEIWHFSLDAKNSNTITLKRRQLPREAPITRLRITCDTDRMSNQRQVRIDAWNQREQIIQSRVMTPGSMLTLHQRTGFDLGEPMPQDRVVYHLLKDPDDYGFGGQAGMMTF